MIANQFSSILPALFATIIFVVIRIVFGMTPIGNMQQAIYSIVSIPLQLAGNNIFGVWIITIFIYLLWFFGIHGGMVGMPFMMLLFTEAQYANLAAYQAGTALPNMITGNVLSYGSGSLPLVIAALLFAKSKSNRSMAKLGSIPSFFGVDEPMYFGFPMILNPIFLLPWVFIMPTISVFGTYLLQCVGWLPYATGASAGSFVPFFVTNLISYGVAGIIWGCAFFVLDVIVMIPFVKAYDKQMLAKEAETVEEEKKEEEAANAVNV